MYAIINKGDGSYYMSAVFGFFNDSGRDWEQYYVVLDEDKRSLVKQPVYDPESMPHLHKMVLITDADKSDWTVDGDGYGAVNFLPDPVELAYVSKMVLKKCREYNQKNPYREEQPVESETDITNLMWVSACFHDAYIADISEVSNGIKVRFKGIWGCELEVFFTGSVTYHVSTREAYEDDPYWYDSTVLITNGFIYLIDEANKSIEDIKEYNCWFKARHMSYRVIPLSYVL